MHIPLKMLGFPIVIGLLSSCLLIAGVAMTFFPTLSFTTKSKPRWMGIILLAVAIPAFVAVVHRIFF
jgi:hypothetical protein